MTTPTWMDADAWNAVSLGGTLVLRDAITEKKCELKDGAVIAVGQYAYLKLVKGYVAPYLSALTGEQMYSGLAANAVGLSALFLLLEGTGAMKGGEVIDEGGVAPKVKGKGMSKKVVNALIQSTELLVEQQLLMKLTSMAGVSLPAGQPGPAKTV